MGVMRNTLTLKLVKYAATKNSWYSPRRNDEIVAELAAAVDAAAVAAAVAPWAIETLPVRYRAFGEGIGNVGRKCQQKLHRQPRCRATV